MDWTQLSYSVIAALELRILYMDFGEHQFWYRPNPSDLRLGTLVLNRPQIGRTAMHEMRQQGLSVSIFAASFSQALSRQLVAGRGLSNCQHHGPKFLIQPYYQRLQIDLEMILVITIRPSCWGRSCHRINSVNAQLELETHGL